MDFTQQTMLLIVLNVTVIVLSTLIGLLLTYLVIRQGVFHGLRAHTRWIDQGKDGR
ncbi:hypothetical protein PTQ19_07230 [Microbacterium esteraromaticum]|uniref:hypothetical protein n=1 Tax=Microbacterium esteraromaticum TaxID=57043 RepID=UPI00236784FF|nr:hypothetical protein [Microbacterium esteraromaticum]WDH80216.1 hypothetical protein PTQ19_07230 [Microbacterium esteraromaticum]